MSAVSDSGFLFGSGSSYAGAEATRTLPDDELRPRIQPLSILVVTNMYPTAEAPTYGSFVAEQVEGALELVSTSTRSRCSSSTGAASARTIFAVPGSAEDARAEPLRRRARASRTGGGRRRNAVAGTGGHYFSWQRSQLLRLAAVGLASRGAPCAVNVCVSVAGATKVRPGAAHLPCGIGLERFAPVDRAAARRRFEVPDGAIALLFPGPRAHPQKAYSRFEEVRDALRSGGHEVHELRLENVDRATVPALLAAADVLVMTSVSEGSPVSIMEALAGGFRS